MNEFCEQCKGACCEGLRVPQPVGDRLDWLGGRILASGEGSAMLNCRCRHLTSGGLCAVQADKPRVCIEFEPGGNDCRLTVRLLRPKLAKEWGW